MLCIVGNVLVLPVKKSDKISRHILLFHYLGPCIRELGLDLSTVQYICQSAVCLISVSTAYNS